MRLNSSARCRPYLWYFEDDCYEESSLLKVQNSVDKLVVSCRGINEFSWVLKKSISGTNIRQYLNE